MYWFEIVLLVVIGIVLPLLGLRELPRMRRRIAAGDRDVRIKAYRSTMLVQWGLTAITLGYWWTSDRSWAAIGLGAPTTGPTLWIVGAATLGAGAFLVGQVRSVRRDAEVRDAARAQLRPVADLLPHDDRELRRFMLLSLTAGTCEEVLYRGFAIAILAPHVTVWGAVALAAAVFAFGHAYQGVTSALKIGVLGLVLGAMYVLTEALWLPMLLHVALDVTSGQVAASVLRAGATPAGDVEPDPPAAGERA